MFKIQFCDSYRYPFEGSDEPQQSLEQEDQCIQGENEGLTTMR